MEGAGEIAQLLQARLTAKNIRKWRPRWGRALKKGKVLERNSMKIIQLMAPVWELGKKRHIQRTTQRGVIYDLLSRYFERL